MFGLYAGLVRRGTFPLLLAVLALVSGCSSGRVKVSGRVVYEDGSPVEEGTVCGELEDGDAKQMVQGEIDKDGSFSLGTAQPGDGARPGKYKVIILCRTVGDAEASQGKKPAVDGKFARYNTSGLTVDVTDGPKTDVNLVVTRPGKGKSP
jgi:hypothetical protein